MQVVTIIDQLIKHRVSMQITLSTDCRKQPQIKAEYDGGSPEILDLIAQLNEAAEEQNAEVARQLVEIIKRYF
jgi:hypothetical protein